jgi:hypothetical protein
VAAHTEDVSRSHPQEHTTRQRGFPEGMSRYRLQLQSTRQARHNAASTARAHSGSRVVGGAARRSGHISWQGCVGSPGQRGGDMARGYFDGQGQCLRAGRSHAEVADHSLSPAGRGLSVRPGVGGGAVTG